MRSLNYILIIAFLSYSLKAQIYVREKNKSLKEFCESTLPKGYEIWGEIKEDFFGEERFGKNILFFYKKSLDDDSWVNGIMLERIDSKNHYKKDTLCNEIQPALGFPAKILEVKFLNADIDKQKEIVVLLGTLIRLFDDKGDKSTGVGEYDYSEVYDSKVTTDNKCLKRLFSFDGDCHSIKDTEEKLKSLGF
jgi:hypothetical protein